MPVTVDPALAPADVAASRPLPRSARPSTVRGRPFRWSKRARLALLVLHVLTSVGWFGVAVAVAAFALVAAFTDDAALAAALHRALGVALVLTVGGAVLSAASGVALGLGSRWGLVRFRWVVLKEALTVAVLLTDLTVVRLTLEAVAAGRPARSLLDPAIAHVAALGAATALSIVKPFGPLRRRPAPA